MAEAAKLARRILPLLDLTNLEQDCDERTIDRLCARAETPHGWVAALCIPQRWISIRTVDHAAAYLQLADHLMGRDWISPATFRFGASTLLDDLVAVLGAPRPVERRLGY